MVSSAVACRFLYGTFANITVWNLNRDNEGSTPGRGKIDNDYTQNHQFASPRPVQTAAPEKRSKINDDDKTPTALRDTQRCSTLT